MIRNEKQKTKTENAKDDQELAKMIDIANDDRVIEEWDSGEDDWSPYQENIRSILIKLTGHAN